MGECLTPTVLSLCFIVHSCTLPVYLSRFPTAQSTIDIAAQLLKSDWTLRPTHRWKVGRSHRQPNKTYASSPIDGGSGIYYISQPVRTFPSRNRRHRGNRSWSRPSMGFENHMNQTCGQLEARGTLVPLQNKFAMATRGGNQEDLVGSVFPSVQPK